MMDFSSLRVRGVALALVAALAGCGSATAVPDDAGPRLDAGLRADGGAQLDGGADDFDGGPDDGLPEADGGAPEVDGGAEVDGGSAQDGGPARDGGAVRDGGCALPVRDGGPVNPGWIGGACASDADCRYDGGVCLTAAEGFPGGTCSQRCAATCPDRTGANDMVTFCVAGRGRLADGGMCVSRCDVAKEPLGCRTGYRCATSARHNEPATKKSACLPGAPTCYQQAADLCVPFTAANNPLAVPDGCPNALCDVKDPMRVSATINGIRWRSYTGELSSLFVSCGVSLALHKLGDILRDMNVVEVTHLGTYNCRQIAGSNCSLSQHGLANAIDIGGFLLADGTRIGMVEDWEPTASVAIEPLASNPCRFNYTPTTMKGRFLYELTYRMCDERVWSIILTPNYNAAHDNHYHVDLTSGYSRPFLGHEGPTRLRAGTGGE